MASKFVSDMSLEELNPNLVIVTRYSKDNLSLLLAELGSKGLKCDCRPANDVNLIYVFVDDKSFKAVEVAEKLDFVVEARPLYEAKQQKEVDSLFSELTSKKLFPSDNDLVRLAHATGNPKVSIYFALVRSYTRALIPLSFLGVLLKLINPLNSEFNVGYSLLVMFWGIYFASRWKNKLEPSYSKLIGFSETVPGNDSRSTIIKKLLFIPITLVFMTLLIGFQLLCFALEIFLTQLYAGPLKAIVSLLPTILLSIYVPILSAIHDIFVKKMVEWENGQNPSRSIVEKNFVFSFLTAYVPLLLTLFLYFPYGHLLNNQLPLIESYSSKFGISVDCTAFMVNTERYRTQLFYFTVTNQVVGLFMDNILPFILNTVVGRISGGKNSSYIKAKIDKLIVANFPSDKEYLNKIYAFENTAWGLFSTDDNVKKFVLQFGFVVIFSTIWPLAPLICLVFNIVLFKLDLWRALKKSPPLVSANFLKHFSERDEHIYVRLSPWSSILVFLTWFAALVVPALLVLYRETYLPGIGQLIQKRANWYEFYPFRHGFTTIIVTIFFFEHVWIFIYLSLSKLQKSPSYSISKAFIPADELKEPPKLNLDRTVTKAVRFMNALNNLNNTSVSSPKDEPLELDNMEDKVCTTATARQMEHITSPVNRGSKVNQSSTITTTTTTTSSSSSSSSPSSSNNSTKPTLSTLEKPKIPNRKGKDGSSSSVSSAVAGATVPSTIPTSRNYDLRNSNPDVTSASVVTLSSVPRESPKSVELNQIKNENHSGNGFETNISKPEQNSEITERNVNSGRIVPMETVGNPEGYQFIPTIEQGNENQFINENMISPTPNTQNIHDKPTKSRRLSLKMNTDSLHYNTAKSMKNKTKNLMSPLGKLKKKL